MLDTVNNGSTANGNVFGNTSYFLARQQSFKPSPTLQSFPISYNYSYNRPIANTFPNYSAYNSLCKLETQREASFYFQSPNFPYRYPPNIDCFYTIKKIANACAVELDFREFFVEPLPDCNSDWLLIGQKNIAVN